MGLALLAVKRYVDNVMKPKKPKATVIHRLPDTRLLEKQVFTRLSKPDWELAKAKAVQRGYSNLSEWIRILVRNELTTG
jgi:hypothetical protein